MRGSDCFDSSRFGCNAGRDNYRFLSFRLLLHGFVKIPPDSLILLGHPNMAVFRIYALRNIVGSNTAVVLPYTMAREK